MDSKSELITTEPYLAARVGEHENLEITIVSSRGIRLVHKLIDEGSWPAGDAAFWLCLSRQERINILRWIVEEELT